jgi:sugar lactone lactonase YvrE
MLWVALGRARAVHRYRADGTLDGVIELPATNPTSVAFGGTDGGDLYITTSWFDCQPDSRAAQPQARRDLPLPTRGDRAPFTAVRGRPASPERDVDAYRPEKGRIS